MTAGFDATEPEQREILIETIRGAIQKINTEQSFFDMQPGVIHSTVDNADFGQRRAQVHIDGDSAGATIEAQIIVPIKLSQSDRVMVAFNPPHGAIVAGVQGQAGLRGSQPGYPTVMIASSEARQQIKDTADIVCPGVADDHVIGDAFEDLYNQRIPGRIQLSEGNFYMAGGTDQTSNVGYIEVPPLCTLAGVGQATRLVFDINNPAALVLDSPFIGMSGGFYDGSVLTPFFGGRADLVVVRDLVVDLDGTVSSQGIEPRDGFGIQVLHCTVINGVNNPGISDTGSDSGPLISGCVITDCNIGISTVSRGTRIIGNHISGAGIGIALDGDASHVVCVDNIIEDGSTDPTDVPVGISVGGQGSHLVANNVLRTLAAIASRAALTVRFGDDSLVDGNHVSDIATLSGGGGHGILMADGADDCKVTNNEMRDCAGFAINIAAANVDNAYVVNNDLRSNTSTLTDAGTATVLLDQGNATEGDNRI